MTSSYSKKITKVKNALENVFVKKTDIQNNLTSTDINKPLSANQGKILNTNKVDKISGKSLSTNDFTNTYKTKLDNLDTILESKASNTHTHGNLQNDGSIGTSNNVNKNVITDGNGKITTEDKPTIPTKTSDLTNDGDGSNVFVKDNDSRLTNSRTPTSHSHGNITNNGRVTVDYDTIIPGPALIADNNDDGTLKTGLLSNAYISDRSSLQNINHSLDGNETSQENVNILIDAKIGDISGALNNKINKSSTKGLVKNDGSIDTTSYLSSLPSHTHDTATLETDGFLSMQDKAKLDNLSYDSGWQEVTFKSGYTRYNDSVSVYVRRKGDFVELVGVWKTTSTKSATSTPTAFASIPSEFTPSKAINTVCFGRGQNTYMLTVDNNGTLSWSRYGKTTTIDLERGDFGNVHCIWMI